MTYIKELIPFKSIILGLTREELEAQAILFLLGGYDTTASTMAFFLHSMAVNPGCQERLYEELKNAFGDKVHTIQDKREF